MQYGTVVPDREGPSEVNGADITGAPRNLVTTDAEPCPSLTEGAAREVEHAEVSPLALDERVDEETTSAANVDEAVIWHAAESVEAGQGCHRPDFGPGSICRCRALIALVPEVCVVHALTVPPQWSYGLALCLPLVPRHGGSGLRPLPLRLRPSRLPAGEHFMMGTLEVAGTTLQLFNGGPHHDFNDAISLFVAVETQEEIERLSDGLISGGGSQGNCGWLKDPFGVSWQIVPVQLGALLGGGDPEVSGRVHQAMMGMHRLNIAELKAAASA